MSTSDNDAQKSTRFGIELSAQTYFNQNWQLSASYTYLRSKDGARLTEVRRPKNTGHLSASYQFSNETTKLNVNVSFNGEQQDLEFVASTPVTRVTLDSYALVNTSLNHDFNKLQRHSKNQKSVERAVFGGFQLSRNRTHCISRSRVPILT